VVQAGLFTCAAAEPCEAVQVKRIPRAGGRIRLYGGADAAGGQGAKLDHL